MGTETSDVIDILAGIEPGSSLDGIRARRLQARENAQKSYVALFEPVDFGDVAAAERYARPVRLVIVPARDVGDAIVSTMIRLQASEVYVGESATMSADEQARRLGEAWERASTPDLHIRLVVFHRSGREERRN